MDAPDPSLTHLRQGPGGPEAHMVDVSGKKVSLREAEARATVAFPTPTLRDLAMEGGGPKGPIAEVARVAAIQAAKRTGELVPLCHPLGLDHVEVTLAVVGDDCIEVRCIARTTARTGVEMEAMTGAAVGALTVYDMVKGVDKGIRIAGVELVSKSGGKSGVWRRDEGT